METHHQKPDAGVEKQRAIAVVVDAGRAQLAVVVRQVGRIDGRAPALNSTDQLTIFHSNIPR